MESTNTVSRAIAIRTPDSVEREEKLLNVAFASQLIRGLTVVAPLDVGLFVLPVPRLGEDDVVLVDPGAIFHPTGDPAETLLTVRTAESYVVATEVFGDDCKYLIVVGHSKVSTPRFFTHTLPTVERRLKDLIHVVTRDTIAIYSSANSTSCVASAAVLSVDELAQRTSTPVPAINPRSKDS